MAQCNITLFLNIIFWVTNYWLRKLFLLSFIPLPFPSYISDGSVIFLKEGICAQCEALLESGNLLLKKTTVMIFQFSINFSSTIWWTKQKFAHGKLKDWCSVMPELIFLFINMMSTQILRSLTSLQPFPPKFRRRMYIIEL